jgi:hypothetical protein
LRTPWRSVSEDWPLKYRRSIFVVRLFYFAVA